MGRKSEFENLLTRFANTYPQQTSEGTTKKYFMHFYKMLLEGLKTNGEFKIPKFGIFRVKFVEEQQIRTNKGRNAQKEVQYIYIPSKYVIEFTPSAYFNKSVNSGFTPITKRKDLQDNKKHHKRTNLEVVADLFNSSVKRQQKSKKGKEKKGD